VDFASFKKKKLSRKLRHLAEHGDPTAAERLRQDKSGVLKTPAMPKPQGMSSEPLSKPEHLLLGHDVEERELPSAALDSVKPKIKTTVIGSAKDHGTRGPFDTISTPVAAGKERPGQHGSAAPESGGGPRPGMKTLAPTEYAGKEAPKASPVRPAAHRMKPFAVDPNYPEKVEASTKYSNPRPASPAPSGVGDSQTRAVQGAKSRTVMPHKESVITESMPHTMETPGLMPKRVARTHGQQGAPKSTTSFPGGRGPTTYPSGDGQHWDGSHAKSLKDYPAGSTHPPAGFKSGSGLSKTVVVGHEMAKSPMPPKKKRSRKIFNFGPGKYSEGSPA